MKVVAHEFTDERIKAVLTSLQEIKDLVDLWNLLNEIESPCVLIPKQKKKDGERYFEVSHPYDF